MIWLSPAITKLAATPPKVTAVAPVKFEPEITTPVPPSVAPADGAIAVIAGGLEQVGEERVRSSSGCWSRSAW